MKEAHKTILTATRLEVLISAIRVCIDKEIPNLKEFDGWEFCVVGSFEEKGSIGCFVSVKHKITGANIETGFAYRTSKKESLGSAINFVRVVIGDFQKTLSDLSKNEVFVAINNQRAVRAQSVE